jgi:hypothetical protein
MVPKKKSAEVVDVRVHGRGCSCLTGVLTGIGSVFGCTTLRSRGVHSNLKLPAFVLQRGRPLTYFLEPEWNRLTNGGLTRNRHYFANSECPAIDDSKRAVHGRFQPQFLGQSAKLRGDPGLRLHGFFGRIRSRLVYGVAQIGN